MNQLSWLIYWAGAVNYIGGWLTAFAIVTFIMCVILTVWYVVKACNPDDPDFFGPPKPAWIMYPMFIFLLLASTMTPSRETVLAIAASEMGEKVLADPRVQLTGNKAFAALNSWLDQQIDAEKPQRERDDDHTR